MNHHETFYAATATVAPLVYIAFVLELRQLQEDKRNRQDWHLKVLMTIVAVIYSAALIVTETGSLLALSGSIHDTSEWRRVVFGSTLALTAGLVIFPILRIFKPSTESANKHD